ncbi:trp operon leader peptide [Shigella sonnei]|uniref:trp operon leader peptide n=13 Tax=Enterobacteriaceae TaxID=543 RepID=A0A3J1ER54_ECOLX|nr:MULTISPECIES: trp operon leader peptide [Enterobacteriaceae]EEY7946076.1 trp operon leader peptide [Escherichia coli H30]EEZ5667417.1 trp operon leader peptide [Escherichia coli O2]EEZ5733904.1 trp operon leader peptide [Escherichia coli O6]EEZ6489151.1 trp operon leader peptide [Escherichia coli O156]EEZ6614885.1 trp operon leader peptide [Escherichia coli O21]EEZ8897790.1 trp operon leader peptide [Escherichia coli O104]EEZ9003272.1 trp operon leader peptide [Escherichia coli O150]EEZ9
MKAIFVLKAWWRTS